MSQSSQAARHVDPAWRGRVTWAVLALVVLWPMLQVSEFHPSILFDWQSLSATGRFRQTSCRRRTPPNSC